MAAFIRNKEEANSAELRNYIQDLEKKNEQLRGVVSELGILNEIALSSSSKLDEQEIIDTIVKKTIQALNAEQASISLISDHESNSLDTFIRKSDRSEILTAYRVGSSITGYVLSKKKSLLIESLSEDPRFASTDEEKEVIKSVLCVPLMNRSELMGIFLVINKKSDLNFNEGDLRLLTIIASQAAQLIKNSQLNQHLLDKLVLEKELELARQIQHELIPDSFPPSLYSEIEGYFQPCEHVGGDYFDFIISSNGNMGIVIADVSGHGPKAALIMTMLKGIIHSIGSEFSADYNILEKINTILQNILPPEIFITMLFIHFESGGKSLSLTNAGHNPILHYKAASDKIEYLEHQGCAINLKADSRYESKKLPVEKDDIIFLYTDGVTDTTNDNKEMFGSQRLKDLIYECRKKTSREIINIVKNRLQNFSGSEKQFDDIAMISIKIS